MKEPSTFEGPQSLLFLCDRLCGFGPARLLSMSMLLSISIDLVGRVSVSNQFRVRETAEVTVNLRG